MAFHAAHGLLEHRRSEVDRHSTGWRLRRHYSYLRENDARLAFLGEAQHAQTKSPTASLQPNSARFESSSAVAARRL